MRCDLCKGNGINVGDGAIVILERKYFICDNCIREHMTMTLEDMCKMVTEVKVKGN